ncbi:hypothetical protein ARC78_01720 [Stenotrophomonas pictorum JCM 9942]|uniref:Cyclic di-GMP receptor atypical PilZ domain-containing protein n=1 Tax=Stenotrophomonas pictorum JCM 9942 TaxID=1236960 RepID=A0A0R0A2W1_9GAMM|nr:PilZ domain-containing protein [Stenotrophomonas pictorum]KRG39461.1 hypothetical protein ARC78_01720 [Stenotrophomonas pictorum JCM 9942]
MNAPASPSAAETELFADTLSCDLAVPAEFEAGVQVRRPGNAEMLLRSVALVEDSRGADDGEERFEGSAQLQRLEARLDLALVLLGRLLQQSTAPLPTCNLKWSRLGLRLASPHGSGAAPGSAGVIRLQPADWLPDHIELPVQLVAEQQTDGIHHLWLRLHPTSDALTAAVERHLFRLHRRQIAGIRRVR